MMILQILLINLVHPENSIVLIVMTIFGND